MRHLEARWNLMSLMSLWSDASDMRFNLAKFIESAFGFAGDAFDADRPPHIFALLMRDLDAG